MAEKKRFLRLESLVSHLQAESDGDEIFIRYQGEKIAPADGKYVKVSRDPVRLDVEFEIGKDQKWVELELWDYDRFSANDSLGTFRLLVDQPSENFSAELVRAKESDARYVLNWSVIERMKPAAVKKPRRTGK